MGTAVKKGGLADPVWIDGVSDPILITMSGGADAATLDAFGRLKVSEPFTQFDSKQIYDNQPLFWDDQETVGSGTTSVHSVDRASSLMSVSNLTTGTRVRQTFQSFNYQPGKGLTIMVTAVFGNAETGIIKRAGYFNQANGIFYEVDPTGIFTCIRSSVSGSPVDTRIPQEDWNIDRMDGSGSSGITLDLSNAQIMTFEFEWLGVGTVFFGWVIDGAFVPCHRHNHSNIIDSVYMSTPNSPLRYEISNDGTGGAFSLEAICGTVITEGGEDAAGISRNASTGATHVTGTSTGVIYAIVGIRLKTTHFSGVVKFRNISVITETNDDFEWLLILNPDIAGAFVYSDITNSYVQNAIGASANIVTNGVVLDAGFAQSSASVETIVSTIRHLGSSLDGTPDEMVLCVRPLSNNADIHGGITWIETS